MNILLSLGYICSTIGYLTYFCKKINYYFAPLFTISIITLIVYTAGLLKVLLPASIILYMLGFVLMIYFLLTKEWKNYVQWISLPNLCFLIGSTIFLNFLLHANFIHYDNFSHWAIIIKNILKTNAFPTINSTVIDFKNYPLGTCSWIYYGCLFLGHAQSTMLFLQGLIIFSSFYCLFGIIEEKKRFLLYSFLAAGCSLLSIFNITIRINNLLVDFILPTMCLASIAIIYTYRNDLKKAWILIPILGLLTIIKSTGSLFVLIAIIYYMYISMKQKKLKYSLILVTSYLPILFWQIHMKLEFVGIKNKFDLASASAANKSTDDIIKICKLYVQTCFDVSSRQTLGVLCFDVAVLVVCILNYKIWHKQLKLIYTTICLNIMLVLYYIGILAMYIFSMPLDEALYLAGFERYSSSIVVLFCGCIMLCATIDLSNAFSIKMGNHYNYKAFHSIKTKQYYQIAVIITLVICTITLISEYNGLVYNQNQYKQSLPYKVMKVTDDNWNKKNDIDHHKYLVYASDVDSQVTNYYLQYITRYMLFADHVDGICLFYEDNIVNLLNNYDYLIIVESDKNEKHLLKKYFNVDGKEAVYKVEDLFSTMSPYAKKQYAYIHK